MEHHHRSLARLRTRRRRHRRGGNCLQPQEQRRRIRKTRRKRCCTPTFVLAIVSFVEMLPLPLLLLPIPPPIVTSFGVRRFHHRDKSYPEGSSSLQSSSSRLYAGVKTRTNRPKKEDGSSLDEDEYSGREIDDDDDDDDDDADYDRVVGDIEVPEGEEWSVLDSDRSRVVVVTTAEEENDDYYERGGGRRVGWSSNLRAILTDMDEKVAATTKSASGVTDVASNNDDMLLPLDIQIDDDEQLTALNCLNDAECEVFHVDEATVANLSNMLVNINIDDDEQLTALDCLNDAECEVFDVDDIKIAEIANMLVDIPIDDDEQLTALDCLNDAECEVFHVDDIKVESITNMLQSERLTPTMRQRTKSINDNGEQQQQQMQLQRSNVDVPIISSSSSSYSDNKSNVAQFLGDRIRTSSPRDLNAGGTSKESYYIATRATTVAGNSRAGGDTGATRYLGDRSRPSPPSRDDAGDVVQSGRWLERVMFGIDNDDADATNNNGDNRQILSSSLNDDDIDDDRSTFDVQENMINKISDMLLKRPPTLRQVISSRGDSDISSSSSSGSYVVPPMISTTAIPSYSDYDPRWRMDDPFESLKVDDNGEERNGLPMLSVSASAIRENNQLEEEQKRTTIIVEEEDHSVIELGQVVNEGMKEDDLQSILTASKVTPLAPNLAPAQELNFVDGAILATASILETFGAALNVLFPKKPAKSMLESSLSSSEWYKRENNLVDGTLLATAALFNANVGDITSVGGENGVDGTILATMALFDAITDDMIDDSYSSMSIIPEVNEIVIGTEEEGPRLPSVDAEIQALMNENALEMAKIARSKADEEVALVKAEEDIKMKAAEEQIALLEKRTRDAEEAMRIDRARLHEVMEEKNRLVAESELAEKKLVDEIDLSVSAVVKDERYRSNMEIEQLRDEYNMSAEAKTERVRLLRSSLRTANERRRRLEKERDVAKRNAEMAELRVGRRYDDEMNSLKLSLSERESEIRKMEVLVKDNDGIIKDERENLLAEIMWVLQYILAIEAFYPFLFCRHQLIRLSLSANHKVLNKVLWRSPK